MGRNKLTKHFLKYENFIYMIWNNYKYFLYIEHLFLKNIH